MKSEVWFKNQLEKFKDDVEFVTEEVILDFTEKLVAKMEQLNLSRAELANKLGVSKAFVTKLLNGNPNLTIKTMVGISKALGCELDIDLCPAGFESKKFYFSKKNQDVPNEFEVIKPEIKEGDYAIAA